MKTAFEFALTAEQFVKAVRYNHQRFTRSLPAQTLMRALPVVIGAGLAFIFTYSVVPSNGRHTAANAALLQPVWIAALVVTIALLIFNAVNSRRINSAFGHSRRHVGVQTTMTLEENGFRTSNSYYDAFTPWTAVVGVVEVNDVVILLLDNIAFIAISMSPFESSQEKDEFIAHVKSRIPKTTADEHAPTPLVTTAPLNEPSSTINEEPDRAAGFRIAARRVAVSLGQAIRLAAFLNVPEDRLYTRWWLIPVFALLAVVLHFFWALLSLGMDGEFSWYSLPIALFHLPVLVFAAIFVAYASRQPDKTLLLVQTFLMVALVVDLATMAISSVTALSPILTPFPLFGDVFASLPSIWLALACFVATRHFATPPISRRFLALAFTLVFIAVPLGTVYRDLSLWQTHYDESESALSRYGLTNEDTFYSQQRLLGSELSALQPERKGIADIFFIGMAGYANQDVFMSEVDRVARLFRERFDAEGHTIRLINNYKTLASSPIASETSLKAALNRVGQIMNKDEDILFLFLTSHGSKSHHFSLELWPLNFKTLDPTRLRSLLDESGIKNRVVVVSACYSGGFIKALTDDHTLAITASALDKNSFGCANENEWTYFGDAYFNNALRKTYSFVEAFNLALPSIAEREKKERYQPSDPQIALGPALREKLAAFENELKNTNRLPIAAVKAKPARQPDDFEQYVDLVHDLDISKQHYESCINSMRARGPDTIVEKNPNAFYGLSKFSTQWPQLAVAYNRYAESYCSQVNDPELTRRLYAKYLRANMAPTQLAPILKFLRSGNGKTWYSADRDAMLQMSLELAKIQGEIEAQLAKTFQDEMTRIISEFQAEKRAASKNRTP